MAKSGSHHVVPNGEGRWSVKRSGAQRASGKFDRKKDAEVAAREISRNQDTELFIHGRNGRFQRRDSHGNDPFPPRG